MREEIPAVLAGERLDRVVALLTGLSRAAVAELISAGSVHVNGTPRTVRSARLAEGEILELDVPLVVAPVGPAGDASMGLVLAHHDDDVIVVDKPAGLVVHPGAGTPDGTMVNALLARFPEIASVGQPDRPGVVHRLDKGTSGLLVVARTQQAYESLVAQLAARSVHREYLALVRGVPDSPAGMVDAPIGRSRREPTRMAVSADGREARTRYETVETFSVPEVVTLLRCRLETGRTHQIRVHLQAIGHPVVGDPRYGGVRPRVPVGRPFLHASRLAFDHPVTGRAMVFESPLPPDLQAVLDQLGHPDPAAEVDPDAFADQAFAEQSAQDQALDAPVDGAAADE